MNLKVYTEKNSQSRGYYSSSLSGLRAEETSPDLYASIDLVVDKLERQIRKFKTKINRKSRETGRNNTKAAVFLVVKKQKKHLQN